MIAPNRKIYIRPADQPTWPEDQAWEAVKNTHKQFIAHAARQTGWTAWEGMQFHSVRSMRPHSYFLGPNPGDFGTRYGLWGIGQLINVATDELGLAMNEGDPTQPYNCYRWNFVYSWGGAWAGGATMQTPAPPGATRGEDRGHSAYGNVDYIKIVTGSYPPGYTNINTYPDMEARGLSGNDGHETHHAWGMECHRWQVVAATDCLLRDMQPLIDQTEGSPVPFVHVLENNLDLYVPAGLTLVRKNGAPPYVTRGGETLKSLVLPLLDPEIDLNNLANQQALGKIQIKVGTAIWWAHILTLDNPWQPFQREMFVTNNQRFLRQITLSDISALLNVRRSDPRYRPDYDLNADGIISSADLGKAQALGCPISAPPQVFTSAAITSATATTEATGSVTATATTASTSPLDVEGAKQALTSAEIAIAEAKKKLGG
jgi:hypothetical protein